MASNEAKSRISITKMSNYLMIVDCNLYISKNI